LKPAAGGASRSNPAEARLSIQRFLATSRNPVFIEPGEEPVALTADNYTLEWRSGYLTFEVWTETRVLSRRITRVTRESRARLELEIERFQKRTGTVSLLDAAEAQDHSRRNAKLTYRELFRRSLRRQYPGWRIAELTAEADLEHSLSPSYPRALIRMGTTAYAAIGAGPESDVDGVLTFGLIWLDYLRARERKAMVEGLAVFLPQGQERTTCLRMRCLNPRAAKFSAFVQDALGVEDLVDLADYGNLDTRLERCTRPLPDGSPEVVGWVEQLGSLNGVERVVRGDGTVSLRVRGLEFARATGEALLYGIETRRKAAASNVQEIVSLAGAIGRLRHPESADRGHPIWARNPEGWCEQICRKSTPL
jgi:predicted HTH domain antitoxin